MVLDRIISEIPLFRGLPPEQIQKLSTIAVEKKIVKGQVLFSEGSPANGFYVVVSGKVKIFKVSFEGKEQILHIFDKGEFFGEVPMFAGTRYPAHAEAIEAGRVLLFPREAFVDLIKVEPSLAMNMLAFLSQRLRYFAGLIEDLSLKEVPGRLAAYLLYLSSRYNGADSFILDITKAQLASILGTIPETLSRILTRMNQQDLIRVTGRHIHMLNREALQNLADGEKSI